MTDLGLVERRLCTMHLRVSRQDWQVWLWYLTGMLETDCH